MKGSSFSRLTSIWVLPVAIAAAAATLYVATLAPGMLRGDSGEFQWAMVSLNVAHATGYPLFTLLGHAWLKLPLEGTPAWRLNLLNAIIGGLAIGAVYLLARRVSGRAIAAAAGAAFLAVSPVFWFNSSILEVYALNALFLALILWLLWEWSQEQPTTRNDSQLYSTFFVLGLALAHHRMTILALPGILVFLLLVDRALFRNWRRLLGLALLLVPGIALYIYVPLRLLPAGASLNYAIEDIILGHEYAASLRLYPDPLQVLARIPWENFHVGLLIAAAGAVALWHRARNFDILLGLTFAADVAFGLFYTVPDVEVFLTPSFVVLAIWIAAGAAWALEAIGSRLRGPARLAADLVFSLTILAVALAGLTRVDQVQAQVRAEAGGEEVRARAILSANLPRGALLELDWETATAVRYLQSAEATRPDLQTRLIHVDEHDEYFWMLANVDSGRPVYVEQGVKWVRAVSGYRLVPDTEHLYRLEPVKMTAAKPGGEISDRVRLGGYSTTPEQLVLFWDVKERIERDLATFVHYYSSDGRPQGQEDHAACCEAVYGYRTTEWEPAKRIAETFRAAPRDATYASIGMYSLTGDDLQPYGQTIYVQLNSEAEDSAARPLNSALGPSIRASSYELKRNGDSWQLVIFWKSVGRVDRDYKVFVHLLDSSGHIVDQADSAPVAGVYPTSAWQVGETITDQYRLKAVPTGIQIEFGMYDSGGKRLARQDAAGDTVTLPLH